MKSRPTGVTILAVLAAIGGVLGLLGSLGLILGGGAVAAASGTDATVLLITGVLSLVLAILSLAFAYGAWTLQGWAWMLGIVAEAISILFGLYYIVTGQIVSGVINILIGAIIIYYLFRPNVKQAFGRA